MNITRILAIIALLAAVGQFIFPQSLVGAVILLAVIELIRG